MTYPRVMTEIETLTWASEGYSLARYGDGELKIASGRSAKSQEYVSILSIMLRDCLKKKLPSLIPCIPNIDRPGPKDAFWKEYKSQNYTKFYDAKRVYGSAFVTRPDSSPSAFDERYWNKVEDLWRDKDVVLVSGSGKGLSKLDLESARSVECYDAPRQHAFSAFREMVGTLAGEKRRVICCLGATATVLAYELQKTNVHVLDLGHIAMFRRKFIKGEPLIVTEEDKNAE